MTNRGKKKIAPIVVAVLVVLYVGPMVGVLASVAGFLGSVSEDVMLPVLFLLFYALVGGAVIVGVLYAMAQRLQEINGGEEEDAQQY